MSNADLDAALDDVQAAFDDLRVSIKIAIAVQLAANGDGEPVRAVARERFANVLDEATADAPTINAEIRVHDGATKTTGTLRKWTGPKLQEARRQAAERFEAIGMSYVPDGWTVKYRKNLSGNCNHIEKRITAPRPRTRRALHYFLHECAHAHLHPYDKRGRFNKKPRHVEELEAEQWAHARMREHGVPVPRSSTKDAKEYVAYKIEQAERRGAKKIDPRARRFARRTAIKRKVSNGQA